MVRTVNDHYNADIHDIIKDGVIKELKGREGNPRNLGLADLNKTIRLIRKGEIQSIEDLEAYTFGGLVNKDISSQTTGVVNTIYGRQAWDQVNREATLFALLPKKVWLKSGWRVITDEDSNLAKYMTEGGSIPAGEDPSFTTLSMRPADIVIRNKRSDIADALALVDDGVAMEEVRMWLTKRHKQIINLELLAENTNVPNAIHFMPIDRVIGEYAELAYGDSSNSGVITANYLDVYGQDRDAAAGWTDAQVSGQAFGSADRPLTLSLLDNVIDNIRISGGTYDNNNIILTHPETATRIDQLLKSQQRFDEQRGLTYLRGGLNGMENLGPEPRDGIEGGFQVKTYRGIPIFEDPNVVQDVSLGRIYVINLNHLFVQMLMPTRFYTWEGPELTSEFSINMLYRTVGQVKCTNFRKQGKVRDLSA